MKRLGKVVVRRVVRNSNNHGIKKGLAKTGGEVLLTLLGLIAFISIVIGLLISHYNKVI